MDAFRNKDAPRGLSDRPSLSLWPDQRSVMFQALTLKRTLLVGKP
jgi:hypothetical protein